MYEIIYSRGFKRSYKKLKHSGQFDRERLRVALQCLRSGMSLPFSYQDHSLEGEYTGCRESHLKGDTLLMYRRNEDKKTVTLVDIGSHSALFGWYLTN